MAPSPLVKRRKQPHSMRRKLRSIHADRSADWSMFLRARPSTPLFMGMIKQNMEQPSLFHGSTHPSSVLEKGRSFTFYNMLGHFACHTNQTALGVFRAASKSTEQYHGVVR